MALNTEYYYAECHYAGCRYAECHGAILNLLFLGLKYNFKNVINSVIIATCLRLNDLFKNIVLETKTFKNLKIQ